MREHTIDPWVMDSIDWGVPPSQRPDLERVKEAVDGLPPPLREVVEALFYEVIGDRPNGSKRALAKRLGVNRIEVDRRLRKALSSLREALGDV
jgi:DNA-directed RNA polymerase specialized sigma24 family protein